MRAYLPSGENLNRFPSKSRAVWRKDMNDDRA